MLYNLVGIYQSMNYLTVRLAYKLAQVNSLRLVGANGFLNWFQPLIVVVGFVVVAHKLMQMATFQYLNAAGGYLMI